MHCKHISSGLCVVNKKSVFSVQLTFNRDANETKHISCVIDAELQVTIFALNTQFALNDI